ncbi:MAG TPA: bifunctional hydroxymethylpyrimidine kinase/phosphomethylpyrimidine kinase [Candidatus Baltobacteraceae bacterium]|nr:bifunctional hydroxymethylpyrimidine kinase/phosphomethylpyrimidine kinase [Candidatus Baltobacteraceae bacterium]
MFDDDVQSFPLIGSIQNSVGMGFLGNQAAFAIANALGARLVHAQSQFANAHGGVSGRTTSIADATQFRRDVDFVIRARPAVLLIGFLPRPMHVEVVASMLHDYKGVVLLDPVIGDYKKGLFISEETARAIREQLLPLAQIVTPNRFEAEVLLGTGDRTLSAHAYLNGVFDLGPSAVIITSFARDPEKHRTTSLFTNGYSYYCIHGPFFPKFPAYGAGDVFAAAVAAFMGLGGSPFASALLATALASRAVANTTNYAGASVDPIAALAKWNPMGYQVDDDRTMRFCERSNVDIEALKPTANDGPRLKFAPPKHKIIYG